MNFNNIIIKKKPFEYCIIDNFCDLEQLNICENIILKINIKPIYTQKEILHSQIKTHKVIVNNNLVTKLKDENSNEFESIKIITDCNGTRGCKNLSRLFIDKTNINEYKELKPFIKNLCCNKTIENFKKLFNLDFKDIRVRLELVRDTNNFFLYPHLDNKKKKILSLLIFLNNNSQPLDSGTDIYEVKNEYNTIKLDIVKSDFKFFNTIDSVPFKNNTALVFPPNDHSWHGLNKNKLFSDRRVIMINYINKNNYCYDNCFEINS
jgi:hypothetical protein